LTAFNKNNDNEGCLNNETVIGLAEALLIEVQRQTKGNLKKIIATNDYYSVRNAKGTAQALYN